MNKVAIDDLKARAELITSLIARIEDKIKEYPSGRIKICRRGNRAYYYLTDSQSNSKVILLKKADHELINNLVQKSYLEKVLRTSKQETAAIREFIDHYPEFVAEDIYDHISEERRKIAKPIIQNDEQYVREWQNIPYVRKPFNEEEPVFTTMRGERARSNESSTSPLNLSVLDNLINENFR